MANSGTCGSSGVRLTTCASAPIMGDCGNENGNSNNRIRQTLRQQRQHTTETCLDESQCDWNTEEEDFWVTIASLRASFYGISMWCIGWNVVAIVLSPTKVWRFAPVLFLGIMLSVTALHTQRVYISRRYSNLFVLIPFCFSYTMCGVSIILRSVGDALESITYNDELTEFSFDRRPECFMSLGNFVLMCFVCYCNMLTLKLIFKKVGAWFDTFNKLNKTQHESPC